MAGGRGFGTPLSPASPAIFLNEPVGGGGLCAFSFSLPIEVEGVADAKEENVEVEEVDKLTVSLAPSSAEDLKNISFASLVKVIYEQGADKKGATSFSPSPPSPPSSSVVVVVVSSSSASLPSPMLAAWMRAGDKTPIPRREYREEADFATDLLATADAETAAAAAAESATPPIELPVDSTVELPVESTVEFEMESTAAVVGEVELLERSIMLLLLLLLVFLLLMGWSIASLLVGGVKENSFFLGGGTGLCPFLDSGGGFSST